MTNKLTELNENGLILLNTLLGKTAYARADVRSEQVEKILSIQEKISDIIENNGDGTDEYLVKFKIRDKQRQGGFLDTRKFAQSFFKDTPLKNTTSVSPEQTIAQA